MEINPPFADDVQYEVLESYSQPFLYHPDFHPDRAGQVASHGWLARAACLWNGQRQEAIVHLAMNRQGVEETAKEFARSAIDFSNSKPAPVTGANP